jgi:hypothetical protein
MRKLLLIFPILIFSFCSKKNNGSDEVKPTKKELTYYFLEPVGQDTITYSNGLYINKLRINLCDTNGIFSPVDAFFTFGFNKNIPIYNENIVIKINGVRRGDGVSQTVSTRYYPYFFTKKNNQLISDSTKNKAFVERILGVSKNTKYYQYYTVQLGVYDSSSTSPSFKTPMLCFKDTLIVVKVRN